MDRQEKSRQEWEREFSEVQHNITPAEGLRAGQIIARRAAGTSAHIPDLPHFVSFLLSGVFLGVGLVVFCSDIPHKIAVGIGALFVGCWLATAALRSKRKR